MDTERRSQPNILITGTPGTGKTTLAEALSSALEMQHVEVGRLVKEKGFFSSHNDDFDTNMMDEDDEDKLLDEMEVLLEGGNSVVDYHGCDFFPERWFDLVVVLRTDNTVLYDRLKERGYGERKLKENLECEIMQVVVDQANESYKEEVIKVLDSNTVEDSDNNLEALQDFFNNWASSA
eukprot:TRINITY_DN578_c0_g1_i2.p1 TRINITY_DN578_c0_g1~~TRINITY_DN578_c0_g1_i2.p1  ORF type:complete len:179 (+),score=59.37 TRINITY_DN578_c0_g1_i2:660-1196(+)